MDLKNPWNWKIQEEVKLVETETPSFYRVQSAEAEKAEINGVKVSFQLAFPFRPATPHLLQHDLSALALPSPSIAGLNLYFIDSADNLYSWRLFGSLMRELFTGPFYHMPAGQYGVHFLHNISKWRLIGEKCIDRKTSLPPFSIWLAIEMLPQKCCGSRVMVIFKG